MEEKLLQEKCPKTLYSTNKRNIDKEKRGSSCIMLVKAEQAEPTIWWQYSSKVRGATRRVGPYLYYFFFPGKKIIINPNSSFSIAII
jgi:hypothetical protein